MVEYIMGVDIDPSQLNKTLYLMAFDVPSENRKDLTKEQKNFLMTERAKVTDFLNEGPTSEERVAIKQKGQAQGNMIQKSLYSVHKTYVDAVKDKVEQWTREYLNEGWTVRMAVFPIATNKEGYDTFFEMQVQNIHLKIAGQLAAIDEAEDKGCCPNKTRNQIETTLNTIRNQVDLYFGRYNPDGKLNTEYNDDAYQTMDEALTNAKQHLWQMVHEVVITTRWPQKGESIESVRMK